MARARLDPTVFRLASAHGVSDAYSNLYAPLLPLLIPRLGMSLTVAGTLAMVFQLAASVSQLVFGHVADRWRPRLLLVVGPILSVSVLSLIGVAWSVPTLAAVLIAGGLGGAAFHPTAAAMVFRLGGSARGLAMAVHITTGSVGYALGPVLFAPFVQRFGLTWTPVLALPGLAILALFSLRLPEFSPLAHGRERGFRALKPYARPLFLLYLIVVFRTLTSLSFGTFIPVLLTARGWSIGEAGAAVSVYLFASGIGGFIGGPLADRLGPRTVIGLSMVLAVPFMVATPLLSGWPLLLALGFGGFFLQSTLPVNVTFAHTLAPVSAATVSSLMMGFAWGTGGLAVPLAGMVADRIGVQHTLMGVACVPILAAACSLPLPKVAHPVAAAIAAGTESGGA